MNSQVFKTYLYTCLALLAFAGNSVLCRLALKADNLGHSNVSALIDASSFTIIRLLSGIIVLLAIVFFISFNSKPSRSKSIRSRGSWLSSIALFVYALTFSYAYISLDTATGALILFGSVQITMIIYNTVIGNRLSYFEWIGFVLAFCGFVYLVLPRVSEPSIYGFIFMVLSGIMWALYTLNGRHSANSLSDTSFNFLRTLPLIIALLLIVMVTQNNLYITPAGIYLAVLSGGLASGAGYAIWYLALKALSVTRAAIVQLLVPIIAAIGGVIFVHEPLSIRLLISTIMVLGGISLVVYSKTMTRGFNKQFRKTNKTN